MSGASPQDTVEHLTEIVAGLLGVSADSIGPEDDLILLGMDSLRMMRALTMLRACGQSIRFALMAQQPTITAWSRLVVWEPAGRAGAPVAAARRQADDEPFELTPVQHAYWFGRDDRLMLGGVGAQYYVELDGAGVSPVRLRSSIHMLLARHPMLCSAVTEDGRQRILSRPAWPGLRVFDNSRSDEHKLQDVLAKRRDELAHQTLCPEAGVVFDAALSVLPQGKTRVHLTIDMMVADADSFRILLNDLERIYHGSADELAPLGYSFAQYVRDTREWIESASQQAREYWMRRLSDLPRAPMLPTIPWQEAPSRRVTRREWRLSREETAVLERLSKEHGLSLATVMMTAFAETVASFSENKRFLLTVPFYLREQLHPDVGSVVGDFTNLMLLDCDLSQPLSFVEQARRLQHQLYQDADHLAYSAMSVLRDLTKEWGEPALAPVVFTSGLSIGDLYSSRVRGTFGDPVWTVSQVPQTLLDCQVLEFGGGVLVNWDCVEGVFLPGVLEGMFSGFVGLLGWLVGGDWLGVVPSLVSVDRGVCVGGMGLRVWCRRGCCMRGFLVGRGWSRCGWRCWGRGWRFRLVSWRRGRCGWRGFWWVRVWVLVIGLGCRWLRGWISLLWCWGCWRRVVFMCR